MQKTTSRTRKSLLYALIGSSLFWHAPVTYAEETPEPVPAAEQTTQGQASSGQTAGQRVFTLEGVEITASRETRPPAYAGGQVARGGNVGVLGNKDFMDTPFSVTSYTAQTMEDQQAATLYDVLINDPTIRFTTPNGHIMENYTIRGFGVSNDHLYFNGLQGLAPDNHAPVEFLERVEVLKGPSSFLYGGVSTSVGGAITWCPSAPVMRMSPPLPPTIPPRPNWAAILISDDALAKTRNGAFASTACMATAILRPTVSPRNGC